MIAGVSVFIFGSHFVDDVTASLLLAVWAVAAMTDVDKGQVRR